MAIQIIHATIKAEEDGIRLDRWFKRNYTNINFTIIAKLMRKGQIRLDGKRVEISTRIMEGQDLRFPDISQYQTVIAKSKPSLSKKKIQEYADDLIENIIFMDNHILAINKPSGLAVQDGTKINVSLDRLLEFLKFDNDEKPKLIHRLDRDTSGVIIVARSTKVAADFALMMRNREIKKTYLAVLEGVPNPKSGKIDVPIAKVRGEKYDSVKPNTNADKAITHYQVLDHAGKIVSLVKMELITGKTHQLRVHSNEIGCPIIGDDKYNKLKTKLPDVDDQLHLHSFCAQFSYKGKKYDITAPLPQHIKNTLELFDLHLRD